LPAAARTLVSRTPLLYDVRRSYVALQAHALIANPNNKHEAPQNLHRTTHPRKVPWLPTSREHGANAKASRYLRAY
jgi:hypothetical protein